MLLACWSLLRRRFCDSLSGLTGMLTALEMCPTNKKAKLSANPQLIPKHKSFSEPRLKYYILNYTMIDHLLSGSGCRVTVACSASAVTSRVGNVRPSPWLQQTRGNSRLCAATRQQDLHRNFNKMSIQHVGMLSTLKIHT